MTAFLSFQDSAGFRFESVCPQRGMCDILHLGLESVRPRSSRTDVVAGEAIKGSHDGNTQSGFGSLITCVAADDDPTCARLRALALMRRLVVALWLDQVLFMHTPLPPQGRTRGQHLSGVRRDAFGPSAGPR